MGLLGVGVELSEMRVGLQLHPSNCLLAPLKAIKGSSLSPKNLLRLTQGVTGRLPGDVGYTSVCFPIMALDLSVSPGSSVKVPFTEMLPTDYKIHPFKVYSSVASGKFLRLYNPCPYLIPEHFCHPIKKAHTH